MTETHNDANTLTIVGIGASAGGLEALQSLFAHFHDSSGFVFVVIQHLSPDFKSLMDELLARHTNMSIKKVEDFAEIEAETIYLIPPKKELSILGEKIIARDYDPTQSPRLPIDHFFESLAEQKTSQAVAVILSGTGSDGTKGAEAIKNYGGLVIAQAPETSKFDGMPKSVIRANLADKVLAPEDMPKFLKTYCGELQKTPLFSEIELDEIGYALLLSQLQRVSGIDFISYRSSTIIRRIERRLKILGLHSLQEYCDLIMQDMEEVKRLHADLLIGVTQFFRNKESFALLEEKIIPDILQHAGKNPIRVWVAGCSTGEEAYTIAILFKEAMFQAGMANEFKIFATDIDADAVKTASSGIYSENIKTEIEAKYFEKYFQKRENGFEVVPLLRNAILFSVHNLFRDPPFGRIDLVSCRNVLIYFKPELQRRVLSLFHFALRTDGYLFLGKSEALGENYRQYKTVHATAKIFQKTSDFSEPVQLGLRFEQDRGLRRGQEGPKPFDYAQVLREAPRASYQKDSSLQRAYDEIITYFSESAFLFDHEYMLLHVFGQASSYLAVQQGRQSLQILKMLPKDLALAIRTAVDRLSQGEKEITFSDIRLDQSPRLLELKLIKFSQGASLNHILYLAIVKEKRDDYHADRSNAKEEFDLQRYSYNQIHNLEDQLNSMKESLQSTIEELETTNEELQSANEELMSSNEELQSSNEELQSVNEELYTVNAEYQSKIEELQQAHRDIEFLLRTSNIGMIFLDATLKIRRYNSEILRLVNILPHDIGRPITDISFLQEQELIIKTLREVAFDRKTKLIQIRSNQGIFALRFVFVQQDYQSLSDKSKDFGFVISAFDMEDFPSPR